MPIALLFLQTLLYAGGPWLIMYGVRRNRLVRSLGPAATAFVVGLALRAASPSLIDVKLGEGAFAVTALLSFPLLTLSVPLVRWARKAGDAARAFAAACLSVPLGAAAAYFFFPAPEGLNAAHVSALMTGVYLGGTPNIAALGVALQVPQATLAAVNLSDILLSSIYFLVLLPLARRAGNRETREIMDETKPARLSGRGVARCLLIALGVAAVGAAAALGASALWTRLSPDTANAALFPLLITGVTTASLLAHATPAPRFNLPYSATGDYFILSFCIVFGSLAPVGEGLKLQLDTPMYVGGGLLCILAMYYGACRVLRVPFGTSLIVSAATVFSPPFVPPIAQGLGSRSQTLNGLATGTLGYAAGNYLGLALAWALG